MGPRPDEPPPLLVMLRYGATRWDQARETARPLPLGRGMGRGQTGRAAGDASKTPGGPVPRAAPAAVRLRRGERRQDAAAEVHRLLAVLHRRQFQQPLLRRSRSRDPGHPVHHDRRHAVRDSAGHRLGGVPGRVRFGWAGDPDHSHVHQHAGGGPEHRVRPVRPGVLRAVPVPAAGFRAQAVHPGGLDDAGGPDPAGDDPRQRGGHSRGPAILSRKGRWPWAPADSTPS